jgi:hypothetical protein
MTLAWLLGSCSPPGPGLASGAASSSPYDLGCGEDVDTPAQLDELRAELRR